MVRALVPICLYCLNCWKFDPLILRKIIKIVATRCQILRLMHQIRFRLGLCPRPRWRSLHRSPRPPSWIEGGLLLREGGGREGRGWWPRAGWAREGRRREGREGEGKFAPAPSKYIWIDAAVGRGIL